MAMVSVRGGSLWVDWQPKLVDLVWGLAATLALRLHSLNQWDELSQWLRHDVSTINIVMVIITFCVSRRRCKMCCGHARLCVCLCVCLSAAVRPHCCTNPDVIWGRGRDCPLVVHYWADLQLGHGLRCYGNITRTLVTSLRPSRDMMT